MSQQQYHQIKQERDGFAYEKSAAEQLLANAKIEIASLSEKLVGSDQQNQEKQARIDELHRQNQQVQANLEHYRADQNKLLAHEKWILGQEKAQLYGQLKQLETCVNQ